MQAKTIEIILKIIDIIANILVSSRKEKEGGNKK
jgi:hypothetical protein